jgi:surface antigen
MRTVHRNAPIIIGAGALALLLIAPASLSLFAEEPAYTGSVVIDTESAEGAKQRAAFAELRAKLDGTDRAVALNALQVALTELGDGGTLIWKRPSRELTGVIKPVSAFRDDEGRVCRHLTYSLSLDTFVREVEGIACREPGGSWSLAG